jgi:paraquat-inducible protein A
MMHLGPPHSPLLSRLPRPHPAPLLACPDCDLLQSEIAPPAGTVVACGRCGLGLYRSHPVNASANHLDLLLALVIAAIVLLLIANLMPIASLDLRGQHSQTTLIGAIEALYRQDMRAVAVLVFITTLLAPALELAAMLHMLGSLRLGQTPSRLNLAFRLAPLAHAWGLVDVFMLGVLVSLIKLGKLATVDPGIALWSFGALILLLTAIGAAYDPREIWRSAAAATVPGAAPAAAPASVQVVAVGQDLA